MASTITTNEWLPASGEKWVGREVLCLFSDGHKGVATWNGLYWVGQNNMRIMEELYRPVYFYIFDKAPIIAR